MCVHGHRANYPPTQDSSPPHDFFKPPGYRRTCGLAGQCVGARARDDRLQPQVHRGPSTLHVPHCTRCMSRMGNTPSWQSLTLPSAENLMPQPKTWGSRYSISAARLKPSHWQTAGETQLHGLVSCKACDWPAVTFKVTYVIVSGLPRHPSRISEPNTLQS